MKETLKRISRLVITHLYVNEHPQSSPQRELYPRLVASLRLNAQADERDTHRCSCICTSLRACFT